MTRHKTTVPSTKVVAATATPRDPFALLQEVNEKAGVVLSDCVVPGEGEPKQPLETYVAQDTILANAVKDFRETAARLTWEERQPMKQAIRGGLQRLGATAAHAAFLVESLWREVASEAYENVLQHQQNALRRPRREDPPAR